MTAEDRDDPGPSAFPCHVFLPARTIWQRRPAGRDYRHHTWWSTENVPLDKTDGPRASRPHPPSADGRGHAEAHRRRRRRSARQLKPRGPRLPRGPPPAALPEIDCRRTARRRRRAGSRQGDGGQSGHRRPRRPRALRCPLGHEEAAREGRGTGDLPRQLPPHPAHGAARGVRGDGRPGGVHRHRPLRRQRLLHASLGGRRRGPGDQPDRRGDPHRGGTALRPRLRHQQDSHQQGPARPQPRPAPARPLHRRPGRQPQRRPRSLLRRRKPARLRRPQGIRPVAAGGAAVRAVGRPRGGRGAHPRPRHAGDERRGHDAAGTVPGGRAGLSRPRQVDTPGPRLRRGDRSRRFRAPQPGRAPARRHRDPARTWAELEECGRALGVAPAEVAAEPEDEARYRG